MLAAAFLGYLLGSIPFAVLVPLLCGADDPRRAGSGNPGATNVARVSGMTAGIVVALLDIGKGTLSVVLAAHLTNRADAAAIAALAAIVGHIYPIWLRFEGGKGVATAAGVFAALSLPVLAPAVIVFVIVVFTTRFLSAASIAAALTLPLAALLTRSPLQTTIVAAIAAALIVVRHRGNLNRLRGGVEPRVGSRTPVRPAVPAIHGAGDP